MEDMLIDVEGIARPVSPEQPTGRDPRQDTSPTSAYFLLKDVRSHARAVERNAQVDHESLLSHAALWRPILDQIPELLITTHKDLEFAAWLIEALARTHGFQGLTCGFRIATILIEEFWADLYPSPDEDGLATRIAPLAGLNGIEGDGTLLMPIACIPLTEPYEAQAYALWEYQQAVDIERLDDDKKQQRIKSGAIELSAIHDAVHASSVPFFQQLRDDIRHAMDAFAALSDAMDAACEEPQPTSQISKRLRACLETVEYLAADKLRVADATTVEDHDGSCAPNTTHGQTASAKALSSRQEAIAQLRGIADFFRETEPHSPMAYGIDNVVRWSHMSLPELLEELIADNEARLSYCRLVGIES